jgi:hypothetical protein
MAKRPKKKKSVKPKTKAITKPKAQGPDATKSHPWRLCPSGEHWVVTHPLHVPPSEKNPAGSLTTRSAHCHGNPSHKDSLYADEISEIAQQNFANLEGGPTPNNLGFKKGNDFDHLIRGWTKYWNEVFKPKEPLDPDLTKALIATESGFRPDIIVKVGKTKNRARGLMQVTDESQKILGNPKSELKDQLVHVDQDDMSDPNQNICAGIRWLFRKKQIADIEAKRELTWLEAIQKYKAEKKGAKLINQVIDYYSKLKETPK